MLHFIFSKAANFYVDKHNQKLNLDLIMCGLLDFYLVSFTDLEAGKPDEIPTIQCAPHDKALLLLSVMDLIAIKVINRNFVELSQELTDRFDEYTTIIPDDQRRPFIVKPFCSLAGTGFWSLLPRLGAMGDVDLQSLSSPQQLRDFIYGARLCTNLFPLLQMETSRNKLRNVLITSYFPASLQKQLQSLPQPVRAG